MITNIIFFTILILTCVLVGIYTIGEYKDYYWFKLHGFKILLGEILGILILIVIIIFRGV